MNLPTFLRSTAIAAVAGCVLQSAPCFADLITFDGAGLGHGTTLNVDADLKTQFAGVTIRANNFKSVSGVNDVGALFDSNETGTQDSDLEFGTGWAGGNIKDTELGNMLIIVENHNDAINFTDSTKSKVKFNDVDDEGRRPAGEITLDFDKAIADFGFDFIDVEDLSNYGAEKWKLSFYEDTTLIGTVTFDEFEDGKAFDNDVVFGDRFANRVGPISVSDVNSSYTSANRVVFLVGGSVAYDNFTWNGVTGGSAAVPEPSSLTLLGLCGVLGIGLRRRRRDGVSSVS